MLIDSQKDLQFSVTVDYAQIRGSEQALVYTEQTDAHKTLHFAELF